MGGGGSYTTRDIKENTFYFLQNSPALIMVKKAVLNQVASKQIAPLEKEEKNSILFRRGYFYILFIFSMYPFKFLH